jgi:heme oxygenase (biliverdin-producing, ferredoxin)
MLSALSLCSPLNSILAQSISSVSLNPNPRFISFPLNCSNADTTSATISTSPTTSAPPVKRKRRRHKKFCPGENEGICEEMRFVAMRLRSEKAANDAKDDEVTWQPSMEGFLEYLVDSKLVFETVERIVNESSDEACEFCFRNPIFIALMKLVSSVLEILFS